MVDSAIDAVDRLHGNDRPRETPCPSRSASASLTRGSHFCGGRIAANLATGVEQRLNERRQIVVVRVAIDEQALGRATNAGAPHLGVEDDRDAPCRCRRRDRRRCGRCLPGARTRARAPLPARARRGSLPPRGTMHVDGAVEALQHLPDGIAVGRRHELDGGLGQARRAQARDEAGMDRARSNDGSRSRRAGSRRCRPSGTARRHRRSRSGRLS